MYQKSILPYFIIPYFLTPSFFPFGAFQTDRQNRRTEKILHPLLPKFFFFSTERAGPYPQAQLYWAGRTMLDGRLNKYHGCDLKSFTDQDLNCLRA
jgi:hypothetical protein